MSGSRLLPPPSLRIGQYWNTEKVPGEVARLVATFRDLNPDFRHRLFSEADAERFIAQRIGTREAAAFRACAVPSMQSDYFRYCFALVYGGVYVDADYRCLEPLRPFVEGLEAGEFFFGPDTHLLDGEETRRVWSAFFGFRLPGHPFPRLALDIATANLEARIAERVWPAGENVVTAIWLTVGPGIPTALKLIRDWGSLEVFAAKIAGTDAEPFGDLYCEAIGDFARIVEAFEGVRVSSAEEMFGWVARPDQSLDYKGTDVHWHNVKGAIFR